ncbi:hypothetical protein [Bremerella sp.]|uniref:hypothetical protein n=1 Tax=Bremerella sp. TaxID=2795602 RepID=UPI00391876BA
MFLLAEFSLVGTGIVVLVTVLCISYASFEAYRKKTPERRIRENGQPVLAVLVMANSQFLSDTKIPMAPALTLVTFDPPSLRLLQEMREIGSELFKLYTCDPYMVITLPKHQQAVAELIKNDRYVEGRRNQVPLEMTGGRVLYMVDTMLERKRIPPHAGHTRALACMVTGTDQGEIMVLPYEDELAQRIYQSVGAV